MQRGLTGQYEPSTGAGEECRAFVPAPLPPAPALVVDARLQERLDLAHLALGRLDSVATLLPAPSVFLYGYVRKEAVLSSQIEGTHSSLADLLLYEVEAAPGAPVEDVQEVSCYVAALEHAIKRMREGLPLCLRLLSEAHAILLTHGRGAGKAPGEWRRTQNWVGGTRPSQAVFVPPPPQRVQESLAALERFLNDEPQRHSPLIKAALAHVQFETIHPFLDGNGRLGRMLIPLVLASEGVLREPLLYLSLFFKTHRGAYYDLLQKVRLEGDWEAWVEFFAEAVADTAAQAVGTAQALNRLVQTDRRTAQGYGRMAGSALLVLDVLFERPVRTIASICERTRQSPNTVAKMLDLLARGGVVREATGQRRNRVYVYQGYLDILNREVAEG
jgi:Fic family protein